MEAPTGCSSVSGGPLLFNPRTEDYIDAEPEKEMARTKSEELDMRQSVNSWTLTVLLTCAPCIAGCDGGGPTQEEQQLTSNMQGLANAYGQCTSQSRGRPPRNEAQLRKFIESQGPGWLEQYQAETVDDIFISSRDGKPYVVLYGKPRGKYIAYEQEGVNGTRFVADNLGISIEMDEATFRQEVPYAK